MGNTDDRTELNTVIRIGTRGSRLALAQAEGVAKLFSQTLKRESTVVTIKTLGDRVLDRPLRELGTQGVFTKELEQALLDNGVDVVVHCLKDMPTAAVPGLEIAAFLKREEVHDCLVFSKERFSTLPGLEDMPAGFRIGTSALRRRAQILRKNSQIEVLDCRGNLDTRIDKLLRSEFDALCLAAAGINRLGLRTDARLGIVDLSERDFYPSAGQGCLVLQVRKNSELKKALKRLTHKETAICAGYERSLLSVLEGGCSLPFGVFTEIVDGELILKAILLSADGTEHVTLSESTRDLSDAHLVQNLLTEIRERGMEHLLRPGK